MTHVSFPIGGPVQRAFGVFLTATGVTAAALLGVSCNQAQGSFISTFHFEAKPGVIGALTQWQNVRFSDGTECRVSFTGPRMESENLHCEMGRRVKDTKDETLSLDPYRQMLRHREDNTTCYTHSAAGRAPMTFCSTPDGRPPAPAAPKQAKVGSGLS